MIEFYRAYPDKFLKNYFGITLSTYQKLLLNSSLIYKRPNKSGLVNYRTKQEILNETIKLLYSERNMYYENRKYSYNK